MYQELVPITSNQEIMPGVYLMRVEAPDLASEARPGQFIMIACDNGNKRLLRRPISIYQIDAISITFLFASSGTGTEWLSQRQPGEKIDLLGPMGSGFSIEPDSRNLLMVAGGMGIAPLCFLSQEALKKDRQVKLLVGAKTVCQICPDQLIPAGCTVITATEDGTAGEKGLVTTLLPQYAQWADQVFICGPLPMFKAIAKNYSQSLKGKNVQVSLEVRMGCGLGFCYACTIKTRQGLKQVCKDGPVFSIDDILWDELK